MEKFKAKFDDTSQSSINAWITCLAKEKGPKKRFQYCLKPNSFKNFRAIQEHSGGTVVDPSLQDNVLLPEDFTEYIYHVEKANEVHSMINSGLIPGGISLKRTGYQCFSQPWTRCTSIKIWKKFNTIWTNPELRSTKILGAFTKTQYRAARNSFWNNCHGPKRRIQIM